MGMGGGLRRNTHTHQTDATLNPVFPERVMSFTTWALAILSSTLLHLRNLIKSFKCVKSSKASQTMEIKDYVGAFKSHCLTALVPKHGYQINSSKHMTLLEQFNGHR